MSRICITLVITTTTLITIAAVFHIDRYFSAIGLENIGKATSGILTTAIGFLIYFLLKNAK